MKVTSSMRTLHHLQRQTWPRWERAERSGTAVGALVVVAIAFALFTWVVAAAWWYGPIAAAAFVLGFVGHEVAHGLVGMLRGQIWEAVVFGASGGFVGVRLGSRDERPRTNIDQLLITVAGPLAEICWGLVIMLGAAPNAPLVIAGQLSVLDGALQLLIPLPHSDGPRFYTAAGRLLRGRGTEAWFTTPSA